VPDWHEKPPERYMALDPRRGGPYYRAAGSSKPVVGSSHGTSEIQLQGFILGILESRCDRRMDSRLEEISDVALVPRSCSTGHESRYGSFPESAEVGYWTCILLSGPVPYVLTPCDSNIALSATIAAEHPRFFFIGECWVEGFMSGKAMELNDIAPIDFILC
jgi:hypothetical protein